MRRGQTNEEAHMATKTGEQELLNLEKQYWQAMKNKDVDGALRLTDDPCLVAGAHGVRSIDRQTFISIMKKMPATVHDFVVKDDAHVRLLRDDVAIVAYTVCEELITPEGKTITLDAADTSTWVRRDGRWLCAMHTESILGDPLASKGEPNTAHA